uniref:Uncharacterized protein n=1 Tax=Arundo donax TaxID=35708 RepID=A0A0A8Y7U6_ARUDO
MWELEGSARCIGGSACIYVGCGLGLDDWICGYQCLGGYMHAYSCIHT